MGALKEKGFATAEKCIHMNLEPVASLHKVTERFQHISFQKGVALCTDTVESH